MKLQQQNLGPASTSIVMNIQLSNSIASSSYHSIRPLHVLAQETSDDNLCFSMITEMYVNELHKGTTDLPEAEKLQNAFIEILATAVLT